MKYLIVEAPNFSRWRDDYFAEDDDFAAFQRYLIGNPTAGPVIPGQPEEEERVKHKERPPFAERLKQALIDGIHHNQGEITLRVTELEIPDPPPAYTPEDVVRVRKDLDMSQQIFAALLHVSVKTVQSWEQGERKPSQAAARLLQAIEQPDMLPSFLARQRARGQGRRAAS